MKNNLFNLANLLNYKKSNSFTFASSFATVTGINIFNRKAKTIQKDRAAIASDSDIYDYLKNEIALRTADRILDIKRKFPIAVNIGCQKGYLGPYLPKEFIDVIYYCDNSIKCLEKAKSVDGIETFKLNLDEEQLPFRDNTIDLVISSLSLHWVNDLPLAFNQIFKCLKHDGVFIASMFGGQTLFELRCSLQIAEIERCGGFSPRISPFVEPQDIGSLLNRSGFNLITIDTDEIKVKYPTMFELMYDIKGMAENNVLLNRQRSLTRDILLSASAIYQTLYGDHDGNVPASFQIYNFIGWKPHQSQQQPAKRGSATHSLKDIHDLEELIKDKNKPNDNVI